MKNTILNPDVHAPNAAQGIPFDPTYGYSLDDLLALRPPEEPRAFGAFWKDRYRQAAEVAVDAERGPELEGTPDLRIWEVAYRSLGGVLIRGWLTLPRHGSVRRGFVVGHGYGGRENPETDFPLCDESAILYPCFRGLSLSRLEGAPPQSSGHVLRGIDSPDTYILGGCVADVWCGITALQQLAPETGSNLFYSGGSFSGGVGALAIPWDPRIRAGHLVVPTFGNHPLRLGVPSRGSGEAVRQYAKMHPCIVTEVLPFFDAAIASTHIHIPMLTCCALFDPAVPPPGQFSVYNGLAGPKELFVLSAGHFDHAATEQEQAEERKHIARFFSGHTQ